MLVSSDKFPLGRRGSLPLRVAVSGGIERRVADLIPGAKAVRGGVAFAYDALSLVQQIVPVPPGTIPDDKPDWSVLASGVDEYKRHFEHVLRPYQKEMVRFLVPRSYAINGDPMRCLAGSTELTVNRGGKSFKITLARLARGLRGELDWDMSIPTCTQSMDESGFIRLNPITSVHTPGRKRVLRLSLTNGNTLVATGDHKLATPTGMKKLSDLCAGDEVLVAEWPEGKKAKRPANKSRYLQGFEAHPFAEKFVTPRKNRPAERVARCKKHRLAAEAKLNGLPFDEYVRRVRSVNLHGLQFLDPKQWDVHHRDGDHTNNAPENLEITTRAEHSRLHGKQSAWRHVTGRAVPARIKYITDAGEEETFDLTMLDPWNNYVANGIVVSNSGKTLTTLAAASVAGVEHALIMAPAIAKLVWATEIAKWMKQPSLILSGRGADEARAYCVTCSGSARVNGEKCPDCKAKNGQSYGYRIFRGTDEVAGAVHAYRFVIANYDILTAQNKHDAAGKREQVADLPGWSELLKQARFDLCIADEAHLLRGRSTLERRGETRRDRLVKVCEGIERFWALTGTPIYGRVSDLWAMLDVVTDGLFGRPFFAFDVRYAGGGKGEYGWVANGCTNEEELKSRLSTFMLKRDRSQIMSDLPPKTRQVVKIESGKASFAKPKGSKTASGLHGALRATATVKEPRVVESVVQEVAEGAKVVVFTYLRENCASLAQAITDECQKGVLAPALKARNTRLWTVSGETPVEARFKMAEAFRNWSGAGIFVATIGSVPVAISLKGAQSVHFADMDFSPAAMLQAEDRPYEVGTNGLAVVYYVVEQSVDEHVATMLMDKMRTLETVVSEQAAGSFRSAFGGQSEEELAEDVWKRMEAAA